MGYILEDSNHGLHCECRRESVNLYTDYGEEGIEFGLHQLNEAIELLTKARERYTEEELKRTE